jgi:hypothetical protein
MGLIDIYDKTKNPINDKDIIKKLIELYSQSTVHSFYGKLVEANGNIDSRRYSPSDKDAFYAMMFNIWKKNITSMTKKEYIELYRQGKVKKDFIKLRNFLLKTPDVSTYKEAQDMFFSERTDKELEEAFEKYRWSKFGECSGWDHICSRYLHARREGYQDVKHRLYLRMDTMGIYKIATLFAEECEKEKIPYYFKFTEGSSRDDSVVIYSSTEYLNKYIEILNKIKKEHKELDSFIGKPPILTAPIDNWIGYGSEPSCKKENGNPYSFNDLRATIIENAIKNNIQTWLNNNKNKVINYGGRQVTFSDYMIMKATDTFILKLNNDYDNAKIVKENIAKKYNKEYREEDVIEERGYKKEDLINPKFKNNVYNSILRNKDKYINAMITGDYSKIESLDMVVRYDKKICFGKKDLINTFKWLVPTIAKNEPRIMDSIQSEIIKECPRYNIDSNNFSFDTNCVKDMRLFEQYKQETQKIVQHQQKQVQQPVMKEVEKPRLRGANESDLEYNKYLEGFYKRKAISDMFKPRVEKPRERKINETDEEYERYLSEFYNGGSSKK